MGRGGDHLAAEGTAQTIHSRPPCQPLSVESLRKVSERFLFLVATFYFFAQFRSDFSAIEIRLKKTKSDRGRDVREAREKHGKGGGGDEKREAGLAENFESVGAKSD